MFALKKNSYHHQWIWLIIKSLFSLIPAWFLCRLLSLQPSPTPLSLVAQSQTIPLTHETLLNFLFPLITSLHIKAISLPCLTHSNFSAAYLDLLEFFQRLVISLLIPQDTLNKICNSCDFPFSLQMQGKQTPLSSTKSRTLTSVHPEFKPWTISQLKVCSTPSPSYKELDTSLLPRHRLLLPSLHNGTLSPSQLPFMGSGDQHPTQPIEIPFQRLTGGHQRSWTSGGDTNVKLEMWLPF